MKTTVISFLIAFAIIVTLSLMPTSSWVIKNQFDLLTETRGIDGMRSDVFEAYIAHWVTDPKTYQGDNSDEKFAHALFSPAAGRMPLLLQYAESHPDRKFGWAMIVRMTGMMGFRDPDSTRKRSPEDERKVTKNLETGREACLHGERLDPQNAYFPLMHASFAMQLNQRSEMSAALRTAAGCSNYSSFVSEEADTLEKAQLSAKGYRGVLMRRAIDAAIMLPDFSHMKAVARYVNGHGTLQERRDLIQTAQRMIQPSKIAIELIEAAAIVKYAIRPPMPTTTQSNPKVTDTEWLRLASKFDDALKSGGVAPPRPGTLEIFQTLNRLSAAASEYFKELPPYLEQNFPDRNAQLWQVVLMTAPMVLLLAVVICLPLAAIGYGLTHIQSDIVMRMLPHFMFLPGWALTLINRGCDGCTQNLPITGLLVAVVHIQLSLLRLEKKASIIATSLVATGFLIAFMFSNLVLNSQSYVAAGLMVCLTSLPWLLDTPKRAKVAIVAGAGLAVASLVLPDFSAVPGAVLYAVALGAMAKNKAGGAAKFSEWITVLFFLLVCLLAGCFLAWKALVVDSSILPGCLVALLGTVVFVGKQTQIPRRACSLALIGFSLLLTLFVGLQIRSDRQSSMEKNGFPNEVTEIRKLAGLKS